MIKQLYHTILYQPIFNLLIIFYNLTSGASIVWAIILITILLKIVLYPLNVAQIKSQKALQDIQPKMDEIKKKYKSNPTQMSVELSKLYKEQKINPASSCINLLIQFPILIAVYQVFRVGLSNTSELGNILYSFVNNPGTINYVVLGIIDFSKPNVVLAILAGLAQFWVSKMLIIKKQPKVAGSKDESMQAIMNKQMVYFMPFITVLIGLSLPSGLTFYWFLNTILTGVQQKYIFKKHNQDDQEVKIDDKTTVVKKQSANKPNSQ